MSEYYSEYSTEGIGLIVFLTANIGKFRPLKLDFTHNFLKKNYQVINDLNSKYSTEEIRQTTLESPEKGYFHDINIKKCDYLETERRGGGWGPLVR